MLAKEDEGGLPHVTVINCVHSIRLSYKWSLADASIFFFPNLNFKKCPTKHPKLRLSEICLCDSTFPTLSCGKLTNRNAPLVNKVSVQTRYLWSWALGPKSSAPYQQSPPYTSGHGYSNNNRGLTSPVVVVLLYIYIPHRQICCRVLLWTTRVPDQYWT